MTDATRAWRRALLALCALGFAAWALLVPQSYRAADIGLTAVRSGTSFTERLMVERGGPAFRAGIRTGDTLDVRDLSAADRYHSLSNGYRAGDTIRLPIRRGNRSFTITFVAPQATSLLRLSMFLVSYLWFLVFATVLSWRRADSAEARALALLLVCLPLQVSLSHLRTPWLGLDVVANGGGALLYATFGIFTFYTSLFGRPLSTFRRILTWTSYTVSAALAAFRLVSQIAMLTAAFDPLSNALYYGGGSDALFNFNNLGLLADLLPLVCAFAAIRASRGSSRSRITWATCSVGVVCVAFILQSIVDSWISSYMAIVAVVWILRIAYVLMPIGLTYSLLNRRLLDIGFALNRAAVFSGVSIVLVGAFVLVEWALSEWLSSASHTTNIAISGALALVLGLSIRVVHGKVEHVVDHVMFRKRREDEEAIRKMAREAPYITDGTTLLERVQQTLVSHAGASFTNVLLDDGRGFYGTVSENDPALVSLRAELTRVDLHALETSIAGDWAYPMIARGRLVGALVLGPKRSQESYAPDESAAITQLANSAGGALDVLAANGDREGDALAQLTKAVTALAITVSDGFERLGVSNLESTGR